MLPAGSLAILAGGAVAVDNWVSTASSSCTTTGTAVPTTAIGGAAAAGLTAAAGGKATTPAKPSAPAAAVAKSAAAKAVPKPAAAALVNLAVPKCFTEKPAMQWVPPKQIGKAASVVIDLETAVAETCSVIVEDSDDEDADRPAKRRKMSKEEA